MNIILLGPPGSGKGSLSTIAARELPISHISTGDFLRAEVSKGTPLGLRLKDIIQSGGLVGDDLMIELIKSAIEAHPKGVLLDGFPRTLAQARSLDYFVHIDKAFYIKNEKDVLLKRIEGRRVCTKCNHIFNIYFLKPKKEGICDDCGGELIARKDDQDLEAVEKRLSLFEEKTLPIVDYYRQSHKLVELDGSKEIDVVVEDFFSALR